MTSLRWAADGIEAAERVGGVVLERHRRLGFAAADEVRQRPRGEQYVSGFPIDSDPEPFDDDWDDE